MTEQVNNNEGLICDAVVCFLEKNTGYTRSDIRNPERESGLGGVDLLFRLGRDFYALEHTKVEPFTNQITNDLRFLQFIQPVVNEINKDGLPKPGKYDLLLPVDTHVNARGEQFEALQSSLIRWIRKTAQELHAINPERPSRDISLRGYQDKKTVRLDGIPFDITLQRSVHWNNPETIDGVLRPTRIAPDDMEEKRLNRIRTALNKKKNKLVYRKQEGARTVLVFENNDIALTNCVEIRNSLVRLLPNRPIWLDELFYMDAGFPPWRLYHWNWDDAQWHDPCESFDPESLDNVCEK